MTILKQPPAGTRHYKSTPVFTEKTVPAALKNEHSTRAGIWAVIRVLEGALTFEYLGDEPERVELGAGESVVVAPEQPHPLIRMRISSCKSISGGWMTPQRQPD